MSKCAIIIVVLAAFVCFSNAAPTLFVDFLGNQPSFPPMPTFNMPKFTIPKPLTPEDIAKMKPVDGGEVEGESHSSYSSIQTVDGKPVEQHSGGSFVSNRNGTVDKESFGN